MTMTENELKDGRVVGIAGPVIDVEFPTGALPEINTALENEPDNVLLQQKLLRAYREELALLRRVGGLTRNVMIRNDI